MHQNRSTAADALHSVRPEEEWDALFFATQKDDLTGENGDTEATDAYSHSMFIEGTPAIVAALTAIGVTCDQDGNPGDGIAAAGSVGSGNSREFVVIVDQDGIVRSPSEITEQWSDLAVADLEAKDAQAERDAFYAQLEAQDD